MLSLLSPRIIRPVLCLLAGRQVLYLTGHRWCRASVLPKPFTEEGLIAKVQEVLNSPTVEKAVDLVWSPQKPAIDDHPMTGQWSLTSSSW